MSVELERDVGTYAAYLDEILPIITADEIRAETYPLAAGEPAKRHRRKVLVAAAAAATTLVLIGAVILLIRPFGAEEPSPVVTEPSEVVTTVPVVRRPQELVPTGAYLLTNRHDYEYVVRDGSGLIWAAGDRHLARLDPVTGETRVWTQSDDDTFGQGVGGLAPARAGGVWMILGESVRWFDGERFRDVVETPPMMSDRDEFHSVVEAPDGSLWASTFEGGLLRWDGSSWSRIDDTRPVTGAGALAVDADGTVWAGNVELPPPDGLGELGRGVSRYDGERWETYTSDDAAVLAGYIQTIVPLPDGTVWVGTERGVARFDGVSWSSFNSAEIGLRGRVSVAVGSDGTVWAATASESRGAVDVASYDGQAWSVYGLETGLPADSGWLFATLIAAENGVFVGTGVGLFRLDGDRWTKVLLLPESADPATPPAEATVPLAGVQGIKASGGFLWAWGGDEIWRYTNGAWSPHATTPSDMRDLAPASDTLWAMTGSGLQYLEAGTWHQISFSPGAWRIAAEPGTGIMWVSTGSDLYRWDGSEMTNVGHPLTYSDSDGSGYVGEIAVTSDGTVWAAGLYGYLPSWGGLAHYDDDTGSWEVIRPLGGGDDVPASLLAPTPDGDLWVMLADWFEGWEAWETAGEPTAVLTLAHHDGATGEWTVYDEDPPDGYPMVMASDGGSVWLAQGGGGVAGFNGIGGIARFDGQTWTTYLEDTPVDDTVDNIAVAPDGTIWYTINHALYRLEP